MHMPVSSALATTDSRNGRVDDLLRTRLRAGSQPADSEKALRPGLNFATPDSLALTAHPAIRSAALGGLGNHGPSIQVLETRIAAFLRFPAALTFRSGDEAISQVLRSCLAPGDEVIVDCAAPAAVAKAVLAARAHLHRCPSRSVAGVERRLSRLARHPRKGRLVIVVPAVSAHSSGVADLAELSDLARHHGAMLIVDMTHDLGAIGPDGGGIAEVQGCAGRADIVFGSFDRSFAAAGGFAAFRDPAHRQSCRHAKAVSPVNACVILAALDLITSPEGHRRRRNLHGLVLRLRNHLMSDAIEVMGQPSPCIPILLPVESALPRTALLESAGSRLALVQAPIVPLHAPRWHVHLTAAHSPADIDDLAELIRDVSRAFGRSTARIRLPA